MMAPSKMLVKIHSQWEDSMDSCVLSLSQPMSTYPPFTHGLAFQTSENSGYVTLLCWVVGNTH